MTFIAFGLADCSTRFECLRNLVVQFRAVGHDYESPVTINLSEHLLCEKEHLETFSATLCLPENTAAPKLPAFRALSIDAMALLTPRNWWFWPMTFTSPGFVFRKQCKVFSNIEQSRFIGMCRESSLPVIRGAARPHAQCVSTQKIVPNRLS